MTLRRALSLSALAAAVAALLVLVTHPAGRHTLYASFADAIDLVPGAKVTVGGIAVGRVSSISTDGGAAELKLSLDNAVWPLRQGTRAQIRMGGDADYANRYVELTPGTGAPLPDGYHLPLAYTDSPFEFDQLFSIFDARTRVGMRALFQRGAATFGPRAAQLSAGVTAAGPALSQTGQTLDALSADPHALAQLVATTSGMASELANRDGQLRTLLNAADGALNTLAANAAGVKRTLSALPGALSALSTTLSRLDPTLVRADVVIHDIAPGARQLRLLAPPLAAAVDALREVAPKLEDTLARLESGGPTIAQFLAQAIPQVRALRPVFARLAPMLACVRAYSPELAGFFSTWSALGTIVDPGGRVVQLNGQVLPFPDFTPTSSATIAQLFPELRYALVRPPGFSVNQPWLLPGCGATDAGLNPALDPEAVK